MLLNFKQPSETFLEDMSLYACTKAQVAMPGKQDNTSGEPMYEVCETNVTDKAPFPKQRGSSPPLRRLFGSHHYQHGQEAN